MLKKEITKKIVNEFDIKAAELVVTNINTEDEAVTVDLYVNDKRIVTKRVYPLAKIPFEFLTGESEYIQGKEPDETWDIEPIKLWFIDKQTKDEDGNLSQDDPYYFDDKTTKTELLLKVDSEDT